MVITDRHQVLAVLADIFQQLGLLGIEFGVVLVETGDFRITTGPAQNIRRHQTQMRFTRSVGAAEQVEFLIVGLVQSPANTLKRHAVCLGRPVHGHPVRVFLGRFKSAFQLYKIRVAGF